MNKTTTRPLSLPTFDEQRIMEAVDEEVALQASRRAFRALAEGEVTLPRPLGMEIAGVRGEIHVKGAHLRGAPVFALKVATGFYDNVERGLPVGSGLFLVFDATTGFPRALLRDDGFLTDLRTGAAGALATSLLAPERVERLAVVGTGVQARFQLRAISRVVEIGEVRAWSPDPEHVRDYAREMEESLGLPVHGAGECRAAVEGADVVVTVTPARQPVVESRWVEDHATVVAVGSDGPDKQELDVDLLARADKVVVDHPEQCAELGELHHALAAGVLERGDVHATLGEVLTGRRAGREGRELVVCDLTGVGAQDAAVAEAAWERLSPGSSPDA